MDIKNAFQSIIRSHEKDVLKPLYTTWGRDVNPEHVWEEYPRPQMVRSNYTILNGLWDYAFIPKSASISEPPFVNEEADGQILVPFSPESLLSGVNRQLKPDEYLLYKRSFSIAQIPSDKRMLLHFGAVDQIAEVWVNDNFIFSHTGGYLPFEADVTSALTEGENVITVRVSDVTEKEDFTRGKQLLKRGGIFYTAQSGIWQTVWYEWVPKQYVTGLKITPDYDNAYVSLQVSLNQDTLASSTPDAYVEIFNESACVALTPLEKTDNNTLSCIIPLPGFIKWSPDNPFLYTMKIYSGSDYIESYFAMRHFSIEPDANGFPVFCLNHEPYFLNGVLDQGYWPDGLYTAPCDESFIFDIETAKKLGFNMIRKHIKIEPARWYYHCDRLGMIVWQDMVNGGINYNPFLVSYVPTLFNSTWNRVKDNHYKLFGRNSKEARDKWVAECLKTMDVLYNVPSIAVWIPFNEAWGQFDADMVTDLMRQKDSTRLIDQASGWYDQGGGDFISHHNYFRKLKSYAVPVSQQSDFKTPRAYVLSEYGGYACHIPDHASLDRAFGYKKYNTTTEFAKAYDVLMRNDISPLKNEGLCGAVYTQLTDIEEEVNGLITYDRKIIKVPVK